MNAQPPPGSTIAPIGIGFYTVPEAARLLGAAPRAVRRWMGHYPAQGQAHAVTPQPRREGGREITFRDLIELRVVAALVAAGLDPKAVRACLDQARAHVGDERPFSTRRFRDGGHTLLEGAEGSRTPPALRKAIEAAFHDLDLGDDAVTRWRPLDGKPSVVIDPARAFGQPIAAEAGVPTLVLAQALGAEGTVERVARLYEVPAAVVRDAVRFEARLDAV